MEHNRRHRFFWPILRFFCSLLVKLKFRYSAPMNDPEGTYLILANHTTDWDPLFVGSTFKKQFYFVASEKVYRMGFKSKLIGFLVAPIARQKGGSAAGTVKTVMRALKEGHSVCIFPEGNRCWDGCTGDFPASTGKLARSSGAGLITYRISGGYFSSPRWSSSLRKGKVSGKIVGIYSPEELKAMTASQINALIARDLWEDAYALQETENIAYKGSNLAEHVETFLFTCPVCGKLHTISGKGSSIVCSACGTSAEYLETGRLEGGFGFRTLREWGLWQEQLVEDRCAAAGDEPIFTEDNVDLYDVESAKGSTAVANGTLSLYRDRIVLPDGSELSAADISGMSVMGASILFLGTGSGRILELRSEKIFCAVKYVIAGRKLGFVQLGV